MDNIKYKLFLQDLVYLLKERLENSTSDTEFNMGGQIECYSILDMIKQQAEVFNIPFDEINLKDYDLEKFMKK